MLYCFRAAVAAVAAADARTDRSLFCSTRTLARVFRARFLEAAVPAIPKALQATLLNIA